MAKTCMPVSVSKKQAGSLNFKPSRIFLEGRKEQLNDSYKYVSSKYEPHCPSKGFAWGACNIETVSTHEQENSKSADFRERWRVQNPSIFSGQ